MDGDPLRHRALKPATLPDLFGAEIDDLIRSIETGINVLLDKLTKWYLLHGQPNHSPTNNKGIRALQVALRLLDELPAVTRTSLTGLGSFRIVLALPT